MKGYLDHPATIEGFQKYLELFDRGISPRRGVGAETWIDCFIHERFSMYLDANWAIKPMQAGQKEKFGAVGLPSIEGNKKQNLFQIYGYGISPKCPDKELAWKFLRKLALPGSGVDRLWTVMNLAAACSTAEASGHTHDPLFAPFLHELQYGRLSAYQWLGFLPVFHNEQFESMQSAADVEMIIRSVVQQTPVVARSTRL